MDNTYVQLKIDTQIRSIKDVKDTRKSVYPMLGGYITGYYQIYEVIYFCTMALYEIVSRSESPRINNIILKFQNNI